MNDKKKIKISDKDHSSWPSFLQEFSQKTELFSLEIESERKLCELCDYLEFSHAEDKLFYHSAELGLMSFDWDDLMAYHQRQNYAVSKEPLAKAIGIKGRNDDHQSKLLVWDTTCGTGKDTVLLSHFGTHLVSFERHPAVYLLLRDALRRFPLPSVDLKFGDARHFTITDDRRPDVIYYDPMYPAPEKKKSALPRKEMRIFKAVVGDDSDSEEFLEWALKTAKQRVVVKRPLDADPIKKNPTATYEGKSTRYDMYKIF